jgi:chromate transporter
MGAGTAGAFLFTNPESVLSPLPPVKVNKWTYGPVVILSTIVIVGLIMLSIANKELFHLASLMLKIDLFAFGGGFASVPLMLHEIVDVRNWLDSKTFMDGIALGQVTPGPIIITSTFVGYMLYGLAGSVVSTIAIFTPSFLILTAAVPVFDRLKSSRYFTGITKGIFSSFVGLLLYVTLKFALAVPWDILRALLGLAALMALVKKIDILYIVLIGAVISLVLF